MAQAVAMALAGTEQVVTDRMLERLQATCADNAARLPLEADVVIVHEAAPVLLVDRRPAGGGWVWQSQGDLSAPQAQVWTFLRGFVPRYEGVVVSLARFAPSLPIPRYLISPSIDPLSERNRDMSRVEQAQRLARLGVPRDKPLLLQVGPFSRVHDSLGVVNAYRLVKKHHDVRLVLAGPTPELPSPVLDGVVAAASDDRDVIPLPLAPEPEADLNALERAATIVIQKPLRTDFGLDVASAMWKGKPVVGSMAGAFRPRSWRA